MSSLISFRTNQIPKLVLEVYLIIDKIDTILTTIINNVYFKLYLDLIARLDYMSIQNYNRSCQ